jgi:hypothetical protein
VLNIGQFELNELHARRHDSELELYRHLFQLDGHPCTRDELHCLLNERQVVWTAWTLLGTAYRFICTADTSFCPGLSLFCTKQQVSDTTFNVRGAAFTAIGRLSLFEWLSSRSI